MKDPNSSRSTNLGIGFRERETAFDFKSCLNEYVRYGKKNRLITIYMTLSIIEFIIYITQ